MIERLNQLSLSQFIELSCGCNSVLLESGESIADALLKARASELMIEYKTIVNPSGIKALLVSKEEITKECVNILFLRICQALVALNAYDDVRDALAMLSVDLRTIPDEQVKLRVETMLHSALFLQKKNDEMRLSEKGENPTSDQIRSSFYAEIAFMMTYFKMNIDVHMINAAVYANIVHQADVDIRMKLMRNK